MKNKLIIYIALFLAISFMSCNDYYPNQNPSIGITRIYNGSYEINAIEMQQDTIRTIKSIAIYELDTLLLKISLGTIKNNLSKFECIADTALYKPIVKMIAPIAGQIDESGNITNCNKSALFDVRICISMFKKGDKGKKIIPITFVVTDIENNQTTITRNILVYKKPTFKTYKFSYFCDGRCFSFEGNKINLPGQFRDKEHTIDMVRSVKGSSSGMIYSPDDPEAQQGKYTEDYSFIDLSGTRTTLFKKVTGLNFSLLTDADILNFDMSGAVTKLDTFTGDLVMFHTEDGEKGLIEVKNFQSYSNNIMKYFTGIPFNK